MNDRFTWSDTDRLTVEKDDGRLVYYNDPFPGQVRVVTPAGREWVVTLEEYERYETQPHHE